jgi:putative FmdB family regulatory protein
MPTYEYECEQCQTRFEKKQSFHEKPIATCPECAGKVRRVFQPAPIIFKGSGFYVTDSRSSTDIGKPSPTKPTKK